MKKKEELSKTREFTSKTHPGIKKAAVTLREIMNKRKPDDSDVVFNF